MIIRFIGFLLSFFGGAGICAAAVPSVTVSIAPLHSVAAAVMDGVGTPRLLLSPAVSVHDYRLKPSDMKKLSETVVLFWGGPDLETFLPKAVEASGLPGRSEALMTAPGVVLYPAFSGGVRADGNGGGTADPHFWLSPANMAAAARRIAEVLSGEDPEHADTYRENARRFEKRMEQLAAETRESLKDQRGKPYFVFHDAYRYFEKTADLPAAGSVVADAHHAGGARRVAQIREKIKQSGPACLFTEPQMPEKHVQTLSENLPVHTGVLDPLGEGLTPGKDFYVELIGKLTHSLKACLSELPAAE